MNVLIRKLMAWCKRCKRGDPGKADDLARRLRIHPSRGAQLAGIVGDLRRQKVRHEKTTTGKQE